MDTKTKADRENWLDFVQHKLEYDHANWERILDTDFDFEVIDTRLPEENVARTSGHSQSGQATSRSPTLQASPQPQRPALQQIANTAAQQLPTGVPHGLPAVPSHLRPVGKLRSPSSSLRARKRQRLETENIDVHANHLLSRVSPTVQYTCPDL